MRPAVNPRRGTALPGEAPAIAPFPLPQAAGSCFVYDRRALSGEAEGWIVGATSHEATIRGRLFRGPGGHLGLVPDPGGGMVRGRLVHLSPPQAVVLGFVMGAGGSALTRVPVEVVVSMRVVRCNTWVLRETLGWKPLRTGGA